MLNKYKANSRTESKITQRNPVPKTRKKKKEGREERKASWKSKISALTSFVHLSFHMYICLSI